ncbi:MAG TPA: hypothetical protein VLU91_08795 [Nitrososphaerales archaeon]|nr:hypothetical protein [Nitrososphaerales archaeon]
MQEGTHEGMETLWPYQGFGVRAFERRAGEGKLTLTKEAFLFEGKDGDMIGFDLQTLRLVRLKDVHNFEVTYSIQGELRNGSYRVVCTFPDGKELDELPSEEDPYRMSLFRAITGGVVARFLADHSRATTEGLIRISKEKFDARINDLAETIRLFPDKKQYDDEVWWDEELRKRTVEAAESEPQLWDDPYRDRLLSTGANPSATVENAIEKLDIMQEDWVNGGLGPLQRAKCVAMDYSTKIRMAQLGYALDRGESHESWKVRAEKLAQFEKSRLGVDILAVS